MKNYSKRQIILNWVKTIFLSIKQFTCFTVCTLEKNSWATPMPGRTSRCLTFGRSPANICSAYFAKVFDFWKLIVKSADDVGKTRRKPCALDKWQKQHKCVGARIDFFWKNCHLFFRRWLELNVPVKRSLAFEWFTRDFG